MLSLAKWSHQWLSFGFKSPLQYPTLSWFSTKNEVTLQFTILVVLNCIFWIESFAYRVCCTWPHQVLDTTFCYQSLTVLNWIKFWIELLLLEQCKKFSSPLAYASGWSHSTYFMTVKPAYLSRDTAWVYLVTRLGVCYDYGLTDPHYILKVVLVTPMVTLFSRFTLTPLPQQWSASGGFDQW